MGESFEASAQYNDWIGTAAADMAQTASIFDYLRSSEIIGKDEIPISIEIHGCPVGGDQIGDIEICVIVMATSSYDNARQIIEKTSGDLTTRRVVVPLPFDSFLKLFKRFNVVLALRGLPLEGREYAAQ